jgi:hypothetical protein
MYIRKDAKLLGMESRNNDTLNELNVYGGTRGGIVDHRCFECKMYIAER